MVKVKKRNFDIVGIGNAIVDVIAEVDDAYLEKNKDLKVLSEILKIKRNKLNTIINILEKKGIIEKFI